MMLPHEAHRQRHAAAIHVGVQFLRQAMVTCWMMMPRTGGRKLSDVTRIVTGIFERNLAAWEQDNATFTGKKPGKKAASRKKSRPAKAKPASTKKRGKSKR